MSEKDGVINIRVSVTLKQHEAIPGVKFGADEYKRSS